MMHLCCALLIASLYLSSLRLIGVGYSHDKVKTCSCDGLPPASLTSPLLSSQMWSVHPALLIAVAQSRAAHNAPQGLLCLPSEVLSDILEYIPDPYSRRCASFRPFWRSMATDGHSLLPVTHVYRRLREVALSHHSLWATTSTMHRRLSPCFLERSRPADIIVCAWSWCQAVIPSVIDTFKGEAGRIRELHLVDVEIGRRSCLEELLKCDLPNLKSFALSCCRVVSHWDDLPLPLSRHRHPALQYLALKNVPSLPETGFSTFTHLSLAEIAVLDHHERVAGFIGDCPSLESVAFGVEPWSKTIGRNCSAPKERLPLEHLRRVTLHELDDQTLKHYASLLQPLEHDSAYHILGCDQRDDAFLLDFLFPPATWHDEEESPLCISIHSESSWNSSFAITVTTSDSTRQVSAYDNKLETSGGGPAWIWKLLSARSYPLGTREVWAENAYLKYRRAWPPGRCEETAVFACFPALETTVIVADHTFLHGSTAHPGVHLLPSKSRDSPLFTPTLKTLRLVHGFSDYALGKRLATSAGEVLMDRVDFREMLKHLGSGDHYAYLRCTDLVMQTTYDVRVDDGELDRLGEYFKTVRHEQVEVLPSMPVRGMDPAREGCERWPGSFL